MKPDHIRSVESHLPGKTAPLPAGDMRPASGRDILGLAVCEFGWAEAFSFAETVATMPFGQRVITFANTEKATLTMRDPGYRAALSRQIVLPDGDGVDLASRLLHGNRFPARMTGSQFVPALLTYIERPMRIALIGGRNAGSLMRTAEALRRHTPWHTILPIADDSFDHAQSDMIMERVRAAKADILLVSMDNVAQEKWIESYVGPSHARLVLSAGGLFETLAGEAQSTPSLLLNLRLSWLYKLVQAALGRKNDGLFNPRFLYHVLRYKLSNMTAEPNTIKAGSR